MSAQVSIDLPDKPVLTLLLAATAEGARLYCSFGDGAEAHVRST